MIKKRSLILLLGCMVIFFPGAFLFGFPGIMPGHWQANLGASKSDIGRIMFFILIGTGFSMYMAGKLQQRLPFHYLIFTGSLICSLVMFYAARAGSMIDIYAWGFIAGFFSGFIYVPALTVVQIIFLPKTGLPIGMINLTFGGAAALFSPVFSVLLIEKGPLAATDTAAWTALILGTSVALLVRIPRQEGETRPRARVSPSLNFKQTVRLKPFWYLWFAWAFAGASGISMIVLSSAIGQNLGFDMASYVYILTGFNIMNGAGRLICGRLADSLPKQKILMTCFLISASAYLMLCLSHHLLVVSCLAALVGLSFGAMFTVSAPLVSECFGLENFGPVFGLVFTAYGFVAGCIGPWLSGVLLDVTQDNFNLVFVYFALLYLAAAGLIIRVKPVPVGYRG